jgi:uncharacterized repeat protein (TIGR03803 family)
MRSARAAAFIFVLLIAAAGASSAGAQYAVLHRFQAGGDGSGPRGGLLADGAGNIYGTTFSGGGRANGGTVFRLQPPATRDGAWTEAILHSFDNVNGGQNPYAGLVSDQSGDLYGTTWAGGSAHCTVQECGVIFELSPPLSGGDDWIYTVLYNLDGIEGGGPRAPLAIDTSGNLYGTTSLGGPNACATGAGCGVVFQITPSGSTWTLHTLYSFQHNPSGLGGTATGVMLDKSGNLYGTTTHDNVWGTVFKLTRPKRGGVWTQSVIYRFRGASDGYEPLGGLALDARGNLYGTTELGGRSTGCYGGGCGTVFRLSPGAHGAWTHTIVYAFAGAGDGGLPQDALTLDGAGNVYGTTPYGGTGVSCASPGCGVLFRLAPPGRHGRAWTETTLHTFAGGKHGDAPYGGAIFGKGGLLYGATEFGGIPTCDSGRGCGTVFTAVP